MNLNFHQSNYYNNLKIQFKYYILLKQINHEFETSTLLYRRSAKNHYSNEKFAEEYINKK